MDDRPLDRLLAALDTAVERLDGGELDQLHHDLGVASLRLEALRHRLGDRVEASPYVAYVRRLAERGSAQGLAASA
ncbi:MAG: hypothetical protein RLZZ127_1442 [Planctomycetota bacterium]